jgi:segregation and condensation protein B
MMERPSPPDPLFDLPPRPPSLKGSGGVGPSPGPEGLGQDLAPHLVALIFAADGPLDVAEAARVLGARRAALEAAVRVLLEEPPLGLLVQRNGDQLQLVTAPASAEFVRRLRGLDTRARLSRAAMEVLAIVAYRQPITRAEIEAIRGVNGDRAITTLLGHGLIDEVGRRETVGRPILFGTTLAFLEHLGLRSLDDLPPMPEAESEGEGI